MEPGTDLASPSLTTVPSLRTLGRAPTAAVLVLHGGMEHGQEPVAATSGPWFRAGLLAADLARGLGGGGSGERVAVRLLRYRRRGWNDGRSPVEDARWAIDRVRRELGGVPVVLVGHSMGARTAARAADHPGVAGVVALAPWFPPGEPVSALAGSQLRAAHGRADRVTSFAATRSFVRRATEVAAHAELTDMGDLGHYLVRGAPRWHRYARDAVRATLAAH